MGGIPPQPKSFYSSPVAQSTSYPGVPADRSVVGTRPSQRAVVTNASPELRLQGDRDCHLSTDPSPNNNHLPEKECLWESDWVCLLPLQFHLCFQRLRKHYLGTSLVVQWLRLCTSSVCVCVCARTCTHACVLRRGLGGVWVPSLVGELDSSCHNERSHTWQ